MHIYIINAIIYTYQSWLNSKFRNHSGLDMLHLPEALPDETLYSLLGRTARVNGMDDHLQIFDRLFGRHATSIVRVTEGIGRFCIATNYLYGTLDKILQRFTHFPLQTHLDTAISREGNIGKIPIWLHGGAFDHSGNPDREWRVCPMCSQDDNTRLGFSYWRRSHQLPTSIVCPDHEIGLIRKRIPGQKLHEKFWLPYEINDHDNNHTLVIHDHVSKALARIGKDGLHDCSVPHPPAVIQNTIIEMLRSKRLITNSGKLRLNECLELIVDHIGLDTSESSWDREIRRLLMGLTGLNYRVTHQNYVLLVYWLFGSWHHFKERCDWQSVFDQGIDHQAKQSKNNSIAFDNHKRLVWKHREICIDFMNSNPEASRGDFLRDRYKSFHWLLHNDSSWLERHLPVTAKRSQQTGLFDDIP